MTDWETFHNPYHFVPTTDDDSPDAKKLDAFRIGEDRGHATHDRWMEDGLSGEIECRLEAESPFFIGGYREQNGDNYTTIEPWKIGPKPKEGEEDERPFGIPGTSLRGLISSIAEAASNSALRVLDNAPFSYRKTRKESLSAIGMIVEKENGFFLRPLALPTIRVTPWEPVKPELEKPPEKYRYGFPRPLLKVYVGASRNDIEKTDFQRDHRTYSAEKTGPFHFLKLKSDPMNLKNLSAEDDQGQVQRVKKIVSKYGEFFYLIGQREQKDGVEVRGIWRTLGVTEGRMTDIPSGKKHELFLPYTEAMEEKWETGEWPELEILPEAVDRFHQLADEASKPFNEDSPEDTVLPYHPIATKRNHNPDRDGVNFRLKEGDLVFYRPDRDEGKTVTEISLSSIWRGRVETIKNPGQPVLPADFFASVGKDLPPLGSHSKRENLTIAEQMFGVVEQGGAVKSGDNALALAGRIIFSDARPDETNPEHIPRQLESPFALKILDSPKPPSPAMYFHREDGSRTEIPKDQLAQSDGRPNGRKFYLHHSEDQRTSKHKEDWETEAPDDNKKQKSEIRPLAEGSAFTFTVRFENLTQLELGLLCYALRPAKSFRHKLGYGKPLGLGQVRIDPMAVRLVDRRKRYLEDDLFGAPRFSESIEEWGLASAKAFEFAGRFRDAMKGKDRVLRALELLGDPEKINVPVHYPQVQVEGEIEGELEKKTFRWFTAENNQPLGALDLDGENIPPLRR